MSTASRCRLVDGPQQGLRRTVRFDHHEGRLTRHLEVGEHITRVVADLRERQPVLVDEGLERLVVASPTRRRRTRPGRPTAVLRLRPKLRFSIAGASSGCPEPERHGRSGHAGTLELAATDQRRRESSTSGTPAATGNVVVPGSSPEFGAPGTVVVASGAATALEGVVASTTLGVDSLEDPQPATESATIVENSAVPTACRRRAFIESKCARHGTWGRRSTRSFENVSILVPRRDRSTYETVAQDADRDLSASSWLPTTTIVRNKSVRGLSGECHLGYDLGDTHRRSGGRQSAAGRHGAVGATVALFGLVVVAASACALAAAVVIVVAW